MSYTYAVPLSPTFTEARQAPTLAEVQGQSSVYKLAKKLQDLIQTIGRPMPGVPPPKGGPGWNW
jgi:hypothetical protein